MSPARHTNPSLVALARAPLLVLLLLLGHPLAGATESEVASRSPLSRYGTQICTGMVEAFLHKGNLTHDEVDCLVTSVGRVALGTYESAENIASLFGQLTNLGGASQAQEPPAPLIVLKFAKAMHGLLHMLDGAMDTCVQGHSLELLEKAGEHFSNLTEVAGRLAANGEDIVEELSDAVGAFNQNDYNRFGRDIGTAARKALLSKASSELLPEGPPSMLQLVNVSAGLLQGFFGPGFKLHVAETVTQRKVHTMDVIEDGISTGKEHSELTVSQEKERMDVNIDLHRCISQNLGLYRAVMSKAWLYFAEAAMQPKKHEMRRFLAVMLQGLPGALARCGVTPKQQLMLAESIHAIRHVQLRLQLPESPESALGAAKELRSAATHWSKWSWFEFGTDLGRMLQGLAVKTYPHRYAVTDVGNLLQEQQRAVELAHEMQDQIHSSKQPSADELARGGFTSASQLGVGTGLSVNGVQIVEGIAEGLLHRRELSRKEAECLMESVGSVLDGAEQLAQSLVVVFEENFAPQKGLPPSPTELLGELIRSMDSVARLAEGFMTKCHNPAAEAFSLALKHLGSLRYVTGRLAANSVDVNDGIDQAVAAWKHGDGRVFGHEVGRILRKVLLSSKSKPVVPEGNATLPQIVNMTAGMLEGFFGKGFELDISSDHKLVTMPISPMAALVGGVDSYSAKGRPEAKRLNIHIDLHSCIKANLPFFQSIMADAMQFFSVEEVAPSQGVPSTTFLLGTLMRLPGALRKCGVDAEQEQMLMGSVQELQHLHMKLKMSGMGAPVGVDRAVDLLKVCVSDFSKLQWFAVGKDLGQMLREAVLSLRPSLYSVDGAGTLMKSLTGLDQTAPEMHATALEMHARPAPRMLGTAVASLLAGAMVLAAAMMVARGSVTAWRRMGVRHPAIELESSHDLEDFEAGLVQASALE